jgi:hypothetical protein
MKAIRAGASEREADTLVVVVGRGAYGIGE